MIRGILILQGAIMAAIRDIDIRTTLRKTDLEKYQNDGSSLVVEELGIENGDIRIDIAVVNGSLIGYEIKSDADTLERLPAQNEAYNKVFDYLTIIVGRKHEEKASELIPEWWGIKIAERNKKNEIKIVEKRKAKKNKTTDGYCVARLLWRDEALSILASKNAERGFLSKPRSLILQRIVEIMPLNELKDTVRYTLKNRKNWRSGEQQK
jgi:hypothetical protein